MSGWVRNILIFLVRGYRLLLSPWLGASCRFFPTCSAYALEALDAHGAAVGTYLALRRISRCHPWCKGGADFVPPTAPVFWPHKPGAKQPTLPFAAREQANDRTTSIEKNLS